MRWRGGVYLFVKIAEFDESLTHEETLERAVELVRAEVLAEAVQNVKTLQHTHKVIQS